MKAAVLSDRGVVGLGGADARRFLDGLVTSDVDKVAPGHARFAALLTPQGKILFDFIISEAGDGGLLLDCPRALAGELVQRLAFYKLRAKVEIADRSDTLAVVALWDGPAAEHGHADPRLAALGRRVIVPAAETADLVAALGAEAADIAAYEAHRIGLTVPRGGLDFIYGDAFPHETDMDQLGGVDFDKGCFVGQEVVSRMQHRGTARTRIVSVTNDDGFLPEAGVPVTAGERAAGTMGSSAAGRGLAMLRLDRVADAMAAGQPISAGGIALRPEKPAWAHFAWPGEAAAE